MAKKNNWRHGPTDVWLVRFKAFKHFVAKHGEYPTKATDAILAKWVSDQRRRYKAEVKPLSPPLVKLLDDYGFVWENTHQQQWRIMCGRLRAYLKKHGGYPSKQENKELHYWTLRVRRARRKGKLDKKRIKELDGLKFDWNPVDDIWDQQFAKLHAHLKKYGTYPSPKDDSSLNQWLNSQRMKQAQGKLSNKRSRQLNGLPLTWIHPYQKSWLATLSDLKAYIKEKGDYPTPKDNATLSTWVAKQRYKRKHGKLHDWQLTMLNRMGFAWNISYWRWQRSYKAFKKYLKAHGTYPTRKNQYHLWYWVHAQRDSKQKQKLSEDQIGKLNELNFDWDMPPAHGGHKKRKP